MPTYSKNKKVFHDYEILETYEAGIELHGFEVKSVKRGQADLQGGFVIIRGGEAYLTNVTIPAYQKANTPDSYDEQRARRLLLHKKEVAALKETSDQKGLTIVPIKLYNRGGFIKVEIAIVRGKKKHDKREKIKKKEQERKMQRSLKNR